MIICVVPSDVLSAGISLIFSEIGGEVVVVLDKEYLD